MSLLHQQRIRIAVDRQGFFTGQGLSWIGSCPACTRSYAFATWAEAIDWATTHLRQRHCRYCIDTHMPAGREDFLGELYERCPACTAPCRDYDGLAVFPANYDTPTELVKDLATVRLAPVFCDACRGVVAVVPLDPEVYV